jgi:hypothetical protein
MDSTDDESQQDTTTATTARTPARITATERRKRKEAEAAKLRAQGFDYASIAEQVGYRDKSGAAKAVSRALASSYREPTDAARLLASTRLDAIRQKLASIAADPCVMTRDVLAALRVLIDVERREAALWGLDITAAPVVTGDILDAEIERLVGQIERLDALPVCDPWERPDWTPADRAADDVHRDGQHHPGAEVVPFRTNGHDRGDHR